MAKRAVTVHGLRELLRDLGKIDKDVKRGLSKQLREAGQIVAQDARPRLALYDGKSAMGIRPRVRGGGLVIVEQRRGRVTGKRADFGGLQMRRALLPALAAKTPEVEHALERMLDDLGDRYGF